MRTQPRDPPREQLRDRGQALTSASGVQAGAQHAQGLAGRDGTIDVEVASATSVVMSLTGYWKTPTATDTGLGLHPLDAPERLVDTTTGTGTCNVWGRRR